MKTISLILILVSLSVIVNAQESIFETPISIDESGNAPHASAILEIISSDKGMLIPRVADVSLIAAPAGGFAEGLLLYQTGGTKGFYYFNGSAWELIGGGSGDNLGNHTATQPLKLVNLSNAQRDLITPEPGMIIYNTDENRTQYYQTTPEVTSYQMTGGDTTITGQSEIIQSFKANSDALMTELFADLDFNGNTNDITVSLLNTNSSASPTSTAGTLVDEETFSFGSISGNIFRFTTPIEIECCDFHLIKVTQTGNTDIRAEAKKTEGLGDPFGGSIFVNGSKIDRLLFPVSDNVFFDLEFTIKTKREQWVSN